MMNIHAELASLADTKENLRLSLGLKKDVPFSQYASHIPLYLRAGTVFDFAKNQYSKDQLFVNLRDNSEFIRLSSVTVWQDGELVEVANNIPRISGEGLLIEEQRTNHAPGLRSGKYSVQGHTITDSTVLAPDGTPALLVTQTTENGYIFLASPIDATRANTARSIYLRTVSGTGTMTACAHNSASALVEVTEQWKRYELIGSPTGQHKDRFYPLDFRGGTLTEVLVWCPQLEEGTFATSPIPTEGAAVTRSPDILNIPVKPSQTVSGDWDEGVTYETVDNEAVFTGHGYIRSIVVEAL